MDSMFIPEEHSLAANPTSEQLKQALEEKNKENTALRREILISQRMTLQAQLMVVEYRLRDLEKE